MKKLYVDPPKGWLYGFPKIWDKNKDPDFYSWLILEGYPQKEIDKMGDFFYCRIWTKGKEEKDGTRVE
jgi:hypothetical protein